MTETLFPIRKRCKRCRQGLGVKSSDPVYLGLYCSPRCAGIANPPNLPVAAPRECVTNRNGELVFKRKYRSDNEVPDRILSDPSVSLYWCNACAHKHIGHSRVTEVEKFRIFHNVNDFTETLIKLRGNKNINQVAKAAGIRPIRLKELEAGVGHPEGVETLFKVLNVYRANLGIEIRGQ